MVPWRDVSIRRCSTVGALASPGPIGTSWRLPLMPSMMVMVLPAGGVLLSAAAVSLAGVGGLDGSPLEPPWVGGRASAETTTMGSPPSGLSANTTQPANTRRQRPSAPARTCGIRIGSAKRFFVFVSWPRGALRSSATERPREWVAHAARQDIPARATRARKRSGAAEGRPDWFHSEVNKWSIRHGPLGVRRDGRVVGGAAQEVDRHLERLVVIRIGRNIGLRAGLFVALGLEMAAQRRLALGVGPRLQFLRHVLQDLDVRLDALGLDRGAGRREV